MRKKLKASSQGLPCLCVPSRIDSQFITFFSLVKIDDDRLQALLDEIQTMRKFQS